MFSSITKIVLTILFVIFLFVIGGRVATHQSDQDFLRLQEKVSSLGESNKTLRHDNEALRSYIDALHSDPSVIERQARDDLKLIRPDEVLILLNQEERR